MPKTFFRYINSKKYIRSWIGPQKGNAGNLVTDNENMASMLIDYLSSVFNTPTEAGHITIDTDTTDKIGSTPATSSEQTLQNLEATMEQVLKALNDMKSRS